MSWLPWQRSLVTSRALCSPGWLWQRLPGLPELSSSVQSPTTTESPGRGGIPELCQLWASHRGQWSLGWVVPLSCRAAGMAMGHPMGQQSRHLPVELQRAV